MVETVDTKDLKSFGFGCASSNLATHTKREGDMKPIEKQLDKLVQIASSNHKCVVCGKPAECYHHLIGRANPMTRYDRVNLLPVCYDCHRDIHDGKVNDWDYVSEEKKELLNELKKMSYKDFLIFVACQTESEYLKTLKNQWKESV